jgi:hypothetical protein
VHDDIDWQFLERPQVVPQRLFDQMTFLDTGRADMLLEQLTGRARHDCRDLSFSFHDSPRLFYVFVEQAVKLALEAELHVLRARLRGGIVNKARRGELEEVLDFWPKTFRS